MLKFDECTLEQIMKLPAYEQEMIMNKNVHRDMDGWDQYEANKEVGNNG